MPGSNQTRGRPRRFARYENFEASLPRLMTKRPLYCDGIGIFRGANSCTVWVKIYLPKGGSYKGRALSPGSSIEIKLGKRSSWDWPRLLAERDRLQGLADRGERLEPESIETFEKYASEWLERRKTSLRGYHVTKSHIERVLVPTFGAKALSEVTSGDVNKWIGKQLSTLKPATVQRQLATFNAILNDAVRSGALDRNPSERADKIKGAEPRQRFVTEKEWAEILEAADRIEAAQEERKDISPQQIRGWLKHFVRFAYNSGMRRGEILNLKWTNVREVPDGPTVIEVTNTKSGKPRFVTCTEEMETIIKELRSLFRERNDERLFPFSLTTLKRSLARLWSESGLEDVRLHDLRRTHATILVRENVDPRTVAARLGHSGTGMLATRYAVDRGDLEAAALFSAKSAKHGRSDKEG